MSRLALHTLKMAVSVLFVVLGNPSFAGEPVVAIQVWSESGGHCVTVFVPASQAPSQNTCDVTRAPEPVVATRIWSESGGHCITVYVPISQVRYPECSGS